MDQLINRLHEAQIGIRVVDGQLKLTAEKGSISEALLAEIKANKEALVQYLNRETPIALPVKAYEGESYYPLSLFQEEIWLNATLYKSGFYNQIRPFVFEGDVNISAFEQAAEDLIDRYEILRTTFHLIEDVPCQKIHPRTELFGKVLEFSSFREEKNAFQQAVDFVKTAGNAAYDLSKGPLIRLLLIETAPRQYVFAILSHHLVMDGWSSEIISEYLVSRYLFHAEGRGSDFAPLAFQYKEFAGIQRRQSEEQQPDTHRDFWMRQLQGELPQLDLPADYTRPALKTFRGASVFSTLDPAASLRLKDYCKHNSVSPFIFFQALVKTLIYRYTGQQDLIIGTVFAGRESVEMEKQVGSFANILPVRTYVAATESFRQLLQRVRQQVFEIHTHQFYPFTQILKDLALPFDKSHSPLFDVTVIVQNFRDNDASETRFGNITVKPLDFETTLTTQDLSFIVTEKVSGEIELATFYNADLFKPEKVQALNAHLGTLLEAVLKNDEQPISSLNFLSGKERFELLHTFNQTSIGAPGYASILELFDEVAGKFPQHTALVYKDKQFDYRQLDQETDRLAALLQSHYDILTGDVIGVLTGRNHHTILAMLAAMKLGAIYMPIDEALPEQRMHDMCALVQTKLVMTTSDFTGKVKAFYEGQVCLMDQPLSETTWKRPVVQASDAAYIVFTSGSTGTPKPVIGKHEGLINNVCDYMPKLGVTPEDNYLQFFATGFDGFFFDIFPLLAGATLVMIDKETINDKSRFLQYLETHAVTMTAMTPSYLDVLERPELPGVRALISAGEAVDMQTALYYASRKKFFNLYGPAEATVIASFYEVDPAKTYPTVPIGQPCANKLLYVLDEHLNLLPKGIAGELCISGAGIVDGYFTDAELTAKKFVPNPYAPGKTLYRTGDMAIWAEDGNLLFAGRKDTQVKVNGYRVEPGEIENILLSSKKITKAVVLPHENGLIAFFQPEPGLSAEKPISAAALREFLSSRVPVYMTPAQFIHISDWPVTPQGKIDHKALLELAENTPSDRVCIAPENSTQEAILSIWKQLLRREDIGIRDHFFQNGGDSLLAIRVISAIRKTLNRELGVRDLLLHPTVESLAAQLEKSGLESALPPLQTGVRPEKIPLSYAQERLWVIDQVDGSVQYHLPTVLRLKNAPDKSVLEAAFRALLERHEVLRTVIRAEEGQPYQVVLPSENWHLACPENATFSDAAQVKQCIQNEISHPFDLSADYMLRASLINSASNESVLILTLHHIAADGWSLSLLVEDLAELYQAELENRPSRLTPLPVQYADYAIWQRNALSAEFLADGLNWWASRLQGIEPLQLPTDYPRPPVQSIRGARYDFRIDQALSVHLKTLATAQDSTLFMTLLAAFKVLLYRYSNQADIAVGTPVANRRHPEVEALAGFFINTLVLRSDLSGNPAFAHLLQQVKSGTLDAFAHQEVPFEQVVDRVEKNRSLSRNPLFQVEFVMQNTPKTGNLKLGDIELADEPAEQETAQFDLSFSVMETEAGLEIGINYCRDLFSPVRIQRMAGHYGNLLKAITTNPETPIGQLALLSAEEETQILKVFNDTAVSYPAEHTFVSLFAEQVAKNAHRIAVICENEQLTYRELDVQASRISRHLQENGLVREGIVGVCMDRSIAMLSSLLGILKAGGTYLPIDPDYPEDRIRYILEDSAAALVISDTTSAGLLSGLGNCRLLLVDRDLKESPASGTAQSIDVRPSDLAYVIYTSGSTGKPKGAMIEHRGMLNHLYAKINELQIVEGSRVLQNASQSFDISIWQFLVALVGGGTTVIYGRDTVMNASKFLRSMAEDQLTHVEVVPSYLRLLLDEQKQENVALPDLQYLLVTGEILPKPLIVGWLAAFPFIPMVNAYGPTEASDDITHWLIREVPQNEIVPIGHTLQNLTIYIVNQQMALCPVGVHGEILVSGVGVGRGYRNRPELTAEKFIADPFQPGERIYRTGDTGYWLENGDIAFIGRMDNQVKIRGHRIELGEIEAVLQETPGVKEGVVLIHEDQQQNKQIVAYAVFEPDGNREAIQASLQSKLPDYMTPSILVELDHMPLTPNGKTDRQGLPAPGEAMFENREFLAPATETEIRLAEIWEAVIGRKKIGLHDNFFELGGDSIITIQVVSRAKRLGYALQPKDLFLSPTISALAKVVDSNRQQSVLSEQGLLEGASALSPIQASFFENEHAGMAHYNQSLLLKTDKNIPDAHFEAAMQAIVAHHDALRFVYQKNGGGWQQSYGTADGRLDIVRIAGCSPEELGAEITAQCEKAQESLNLETGRLCCALLIQTPDFEQHNRFLLVIHHLAVDGVSWRILTENLEMALAALQKGQKIDFGPKGTSYRQWVAALEKYALSHQIAAQKPYWESIANAGRPLPVDMTQSAGVFRDIASHEVSLSVSLTKSLLQEVHHAYHTEINDLLLAALATTISRWSDHNTVLIGLEGHGREEVLPQMDTGNLVGWLTSLYPVALTLPQQAHEGSILKAVKEQLRAIPEKGIGYGILRYLHPDTATREKLSDCHWELLFNYLGQLDNLAKTGGRLQMAEESDGKNRSDDYPLQEKIAINAFVLDGTLTLSWNYSNRQYHASTIEHLANEYCAHLTTLILHCTAKESREFTPSDHGLSGAISYLEYERLNAILAEQEPEGEEILKF